MKKITYGKFAKYACILILAIIVFKMCSKDKEEEKIIEIKKNDQPSFFKKNVENLKGANFIKKAEIINDSMAIVQYFNDFSDYKKENPNSKLKEVDFNNYFNSEKSVIKTINSAAISMLEKNNFITKIDVEKNRNNKKYNISVSRNGLERFNYNIIISNIKINGNNYIDKYVYDDNGRELFYNAFKK